LSNSDRSRPANKSAHLDKAEDIPAAMRDGGDTQSVGAAKLEHRPNSTAVSKQTPLRWIVIGLGLLMVGAATVVWRFNSPPPTATTSTPNPSNSIAPATPATDASPSPNVDNLLNHLPYAEAPAAELVSIGGGYRLRQSAAAKFQSMIAAARSSGVNITTISAFRSVEDQKRLFFGVGAARGQQPTKRAEVSAPPTYSEHHTGYAIDLGDSSVPATNLSQNFDTTPAFKWLKANAATYSFELSFPKDNIQKVSYEPWHWRFVGDINSLETFYKARNLKEK
jgi:zinc D-Ala-D-Ala carboxypeptidase